MTDDKKVVDLAAFRERTTGKQTSVKPTPSVDEEIDEAVGQFVFEFMTASEFLYKELEEIVDRHYSKESESDRDIKVAAHMITTLASITAVIAETHCATKTAAQMFAKSVSEITESIIKDSDTYDDQSN